MPNQAGAEEPRGKAAEQAAAPAEQGRPDG